MQSDFSIPLRANKKLTVPSSKRFELAAPLLDLVEVGRGEISVGPFQHFPSMKVLGTASYFVAGAKDALFSIARTLDKAQKLVERRLPTLDADFDAYQEEKEQARQAARR